MNKRLIREDYKSKQNKERNMKYIRGLFDISEKNIYTIDDETWNDLEMDNFFINIDRTYSSVGEKALYMLLRKPLLDKEKLRKRSDMIYNLSYDEKLRTDLRYIYFNSIRDKNNALFEMLNGLLVFSKAKYYIYLFLGKIVPITLILMAIIQKNPQYIIGLLFSVFLNIAINSYESSKIKGKGMIYLRDLLSIAKKVTKIKDNKIDSYKDQIKEHLNKLKKIDRATFTLNIFSEVGGLFDILAIPFLISESTYYKVSNIIKDNEADIYKLYYLVGEIEALISIASYKESNIDKICIPQFVQDKGIYIKEGIIPFIKNPVPNTLNITKKGVVITGTNMSGKSTFLRMVSTNILLAQCFNFTFAKEYKASLMHLVSSISPKDDIISGKSYYLSEAEGILRIIKALNKDVTVFCPIDEIFRGTNPVERISASAEILKYINDRNSISIVATHDRELVDMLNEEYDFYYFCEKVTSDEGLSFDYKIKKGINKEKNAIKLLKYIGYPEEIIIKALEKSKSLDIYS